MNRGIAEKYWPDVTRLLKGDLASRLFFFAVEKWKNCPLMKYDVIPPLNQFSNPKPHYSCMGVSLLLSDVPSVSVLQDI